MESENQFLTEAAEVVEKAQNIYKTNRKVLEDDREHLKKIYSNFSSACDYLTQEMKEGVESIQIVLQLAAQDDDSSKSRYLLESLNDFFNKPVNFSTLEANHKMLIAAQKVLEDHLKEKRDYILQIRKMLSNYHLGVRSAKSSSTESDVREKLNPNPQIRLAAQNHLPAITTPPLAAINAPIIKKFQPKYSPFELNNSPPRHASVLITKASTPKFIYVQIEDKDKPLYREMLKELKVEFRSASTQSSTYCPSPVIGNSYCTQYGAQWHRVLIDNKKKNGKHAFFVDVGFRRKILPEMIFHRLPDRFMKLRAQAVRCCLIGVYPPKHPCQFPEEVHHFVHQFDAKEAVAFFHSWHAGQVGYFDKPATRELEAFVTLYPNDDFDSINTQLCRSPRMALSVGFSNFDLPEHREIRRRLEAARFTSMAFTEPGSHQANASYSLPSISSLLSIDLSTPSASESHENCEPTNSAPRLTSETDWKSSLEVSEETILPSADYSNIKESTHPNHHYEDDTLAVSFVGCNSPNELFFRTSKMMEEFVQVQNALYSTFIGVHHEETNEEPINFDMGFLCAVNHGNRWYRAQVVDIEKYPDVTVFLLDKGFTCNVAASEIQRIPDRLEGTSSTLIRCYLYGVCPPSVSIWEESVAQFIAQRLKRVETINIVYQQKQHQDSKISSAILPVTVYFYDKEIGPVQGHDSTRISLNEELVSCGLATTSISNVISSHPLGKRIWISSELPKVGDTFEARASWINTKGEVFLHDVHCKSELKRILQDLKERYDDTLSSDVDLRCGPGDICIVRDGFNWYRGIIKVIMGNEAKVHYVDYGITGVVDIKDVRLDTSLEDIPVKVLRCSLYTLNSLGRAHQNWNPIDKLQAMHKSIVGREFKVVVMAPGPSLQVTMYPKS